MNKIRVLIVDDSALAREIIGKGISSDPSIEIIGRANDVYVAREMIVKLNPDVMTLDVEMPKMDGLEFLKKLMPQYPVRTIMVSSMTKPGARITLDALEHGAIDFILKPDSRLGSGLATMSNELIQKIKLAANVDVSEWKGRKIDKLKKSNSFINQIIEGSTDKVIAIGASTGGTIALRKIITKLPLNMPGIVITQHMPPDFTKMYAERLNEISAVDVKEAETKDRIRQGRVLIAPGGKHLYVKKYGGQYIVECKTGEKVNGHCPSVDVMFDSITKNVGSNAIGVVLTGMGRDGAEGLLKMKTSGARTLAQNERSSVVFGMPREAYENGGAEKLVSIDMMGNEIINLLKEMK